MGTLQLSRAKTQIIGQLAIALESNLSEMLSNGKRYLQVSKIESVQEIIASINEITANQLLFISNEIFDPKSLSTLIYNGK